MREQTDIGLLEYLKRGLSEIKGKPFIEFYGRKISYNKLLSLIDNCAENLARHGVSKGTVVSVMLPNCIEFAICIYAITATGAIASLLSPKLSKNETLRIMSETNSSLLVVSDMTTFEEESVKIVRVHFKHFMSPIARPFVKTKKCGHNEYPFEALLKKTKAPFVLSQETFAEEPAIYLHSGGTTGTPKTVMLSQHAINECVYQIRINFLANGAKESVGETALSVLPLFYGYGIGAFHTLACSGINQVLRPRFRPDEHIKEMRKYKVNHMFAIPLMIKKLLETGNFNKDCLPSVKLFYSGGERLNKSLREEYKRAFPDAELIEGYGLSETVNAFVAGLKDAYKEDSVGKIGKNVKAEAFDGTTPLKRGEKGEICVCTPAVMCGYFNDKEGTEKALFEKDGEIWLRTGDFGYVDDEDYVFLIQRLKNVIKRKGVSIYPSGIEKICLSLPFVKECAVFALNDGETERIALSAVLDSEPGNWEEVLKDTVTKELSIISCPEYLMKFDRLPITRVGKVDVNALKEIFRKQFLNN